MRRVRYSLTKHHRRDRRVDGLNRLQTQIFKVEAYASKR